jgi:hypothetical protein
MAVVGRGTSSTVSLGPGKALVLGPLRMPNMETGGGSILRQPRVEKEHSIPLSRNRTIQGTKKYESLPM